MAKTAEERVREILFSELYPLYLAKVERKGRTREDLDSILTWLTGYSEDRIHTHAVAPITLNEFFAGAHIPAAAEAITGSICGVKIQEITDPLMKQVRIMDKVVDELSRGKAISKIKRQ